MLLYFLNWYSVLFFLVSFNAQENIIYSIVTGKFTCKTCVIDLYSYLENRDLNVQILVREANPIVAGITIQYFKKSLPSANIVEKEIVIPHEIAQSRFPILLISAKDSIFYGFDSLFKHGDLDKKFVDRLIGK